MNRAEKAALQQIDPTIDAYQKLEETTKVLQDHATDVPLGVILGLGNLGDYRVPKGSTQTLSTTVTNLEDRETGSLEISSTTDDFVSTEVDPESIANLSSNDETSISLTLTGKSANRGRGRLVVEGQRRESVEFRIEVIDKVGFLSEALSITERLLDNVENQSRGRGGRSSDIPNRLSGIERRLSQIVDRVQQSNGKGNSKSVDNKIESVINQFEALIQKLTKSNGTDLSERAIAEYVQLCKDAVNSLEQAIKAES